MLQPSVDAVASAASALSATITQDTAAAATQTDCPVAVSNTTGENNTTAVSMPLLVLLHSLNNLEIVTKA